MAHGLRPAVHDAQRDLGGGHPDGLGEVGHVLLEVGGARVLGCNSIDIFYQDFDGVLRHVQTCAVL